MGRRRLLPRRSAKEWGGRIAIALALALVGYLGLCDCLSHVLQKSNPQRAYLLTLGDGRVTALQAQALSGATASLADRAKADELARIALRQDPTAVVAVSALGTNAFVRKDVARARQLFAFSERLSRRDLQTQLWALEDAVGRGDIPGALRHYDIALRVSNTTAELLFPILEQAIDDSSVRKELVRLLAARPPWGAGFVEHAAATGVNPRATSDLIAELRRVNVPVAPGPVKDVVNVLVSRGFAEDAWSLYAATHPGSARNRSRDSQFSASLSSPSAFDWTVSDGEGIIATIQSGAQGGLLDFMLPASAAGAIVSQTQLLPPGTYKLVGRSVGIEQQAESLPYWSLTCKGGRELGRISVPNSAQNGGQFGGDFIVPVDCPVQVLSLTARPSDAAAGGGGQISYLSLSPAN